MRRAGFSAAIRPISSLAVTSPSTMACLPHPKSALAEASLSSRKGIFFATASGPWQVKHLSDRIGRTSRLNSMARSAPHNTRVGATSNRVAMSFGISLVKFFGLTFQRYHRLKHHISSLILPCRNPSRLLLSIVVETGYDPVRNRRMSTSDSLVVLQRAIAEGGILACAYPSQPTPSLVVERQQARNLP